MKQFLYITLAILLFFSCKEKDGYVIEGKIANLHNSSLYFITSSSSSSSSENEEMKIDTVQCDKNGKFTYQGMSDSLSSIIIYMENGNIWTTVWVQNKDKITISGDTHYPELITSRGGSVNDQLAEFRTQNKSLLLEKRDMIDKRSSTIERTDSLNPDSNQAEYKSKISNIDYQLKEKAENFIKQHPTSIASLVMIQDFLIDAANPQLIEEYLSKISGEATQSPLYTKLVNINNKIQRTTIGSPAPDFTVLDIKNDTIHLSTFKGKYFLLTFTATWCEMCEKDNEELSNLRKKIKTSQLEMLTISLDEDSAAWTNVVKEKQLNWHQVVDTHGWGSELVSRYNITEIPANLLIDKENLIVGKNMPVDSIIYVIETNEKR